MQSDSTRRRLWLLRGARRTVRRRSGFVRKVSCLGVCSNMRSAVDIVLTLTRYRELGNEPMASGKGKLTENGIKEEPKTNGQTLDGEDEHPNLLLRYDIIIIDEAHERTLNTDFLLGSLKLIQAERKRLTREIEAAKAQRGERGSSGEVDVLHRTWGGYQMRELKIVVMSATLEADVFSNFFDK